MRYLKSFYNRAVPEGGTPVVRRLIRPSITIRTPPALIDPAWGEWGQ
jgi:hypothetical protein